MIDIPTGTFSVERNGKGDWIDGVYVKSLPEILSVNASIQPLKGNEIKLLPEHRRTAESIKIYTETRLRTSDEKNQLPADVILYDGKIFEIHSVENWAIGTDIPYYKCIGIKEDGQGGGNA